MHFCCICRQGTKNKTKITEHYIGNPPVLIIDLILECIGECEQDEDIASTITALNIYKNICMECVENLAKYYKATLYIKKIKRNFLVTIKNAFVDKETLLPETSIAIPNKSIPSTGLCRSGSERDKTNNEQNKKKRRNLEIIIESRNFDHFENNELYTNDSVKIEYKEDEDLIDETTTHFDNATFLLNIQPKDDVNNDYHLSNDADDTLFEEVQLKHEKCDVHDQKTKSNKPEENTSKKTDFFCKECNLVYSSKRKYNAHKKEKHFEGFICDQCGKIFSSQSGFTTHLQTHKPVKKFACNVCGREYHQKVQLERHMSWHSGEMPFQCEICKKRFGHKIGLHTHKKIHENIRPINCGICGFKFRTNAHLNRHMFKHTGAKPHRCPICGKCFSQLYNMNVHIKEHENPGSTRRNRVKCKSCKKTFCNKESYEEHCIKHNCKNL